MASKQRRTTFSVSEVLRQIQLDVNLDDSEESCYEDSGDDAEFVPTKSMLAACSDSDASSVSADETDLTNGASGPPEALSSDVILNPETATRSYVNLRAVPNGSISPLAASSSPVTLAAACSTSLNPLAAPSTALNPPAASSIHVDLSEALSTTLDQPAAPCIAEILHAAPCTSLNTLTASSTHLDPSEAPGTSLDQSADPISPVVPTAALSSAENLPAAPCNFLNPPTAPSTSLNPPTAPSTSLNPPTAPSTSLNPPTAPSTSLNPPTASCTHLDPSGSPSTSLDQSADPSSSVVPPAALSSAEILPAAPCNFLNSPTAPSTSLNPPTARSTCPNPPTASSTHLDPSEAPSTSLDQSADPSSSVVPPAALSSAEILPAAPCNFLNSPTAPSTSLNPPTARSTCPNPPTASSTHLDPSEAPSTSLDQSADPSSPDNDIPAAASSITVTKSRKRKRKENDWVVNKRKKAVESGQAHVNSKGKAIPPKAIKTTKDCMSGCKFKCSMKINGEEREKVFLEFYALNHCQKQMFLAANTKAENAKRLTKGTQTTRKKSFSYFFHLEGEAIRVCKAFFLGTLSVSQKMVYRAQDTSESLTGCPLPDGRGKKTKEKLVDEKEGVRKHIMSFPKVESHYCRASTSKEYLESELSLPKMYSLYCDLCVKGGTQPVKLSMYRHVFDTEFNIGFHKPKTDRCDFCEEIKTKKKQKTMTENDSEREKVHLDKKLSMRQEREKDRALKRDDTAVISFDLQNVITCPKVEIDNFFYKHKLRVYNLTGHVVVNGRKQAYCVIWNECLAGRGGNEIASALIKIFQDVLIKNPTVEHIITWSDSCVSQNRNHFMSTAVMMFLSQNQFIQSVVMKYSIAGHSCVQEVDNVHSQLEKSFQVTEFFSPLSLIRVILKTNRNKPFRVIQLKKSDCFDYQRSGKPLNFKGVPYSQVCALHFLNDSFEVGFKLSFSQANFLYSNTNSKATTRNSKATPVSLADLLLNPKPQGFIPLSDAKKKDLQSMLKFMPEQDKEYFNNILKF